MPQQKKNGFVLFAEEYMRDQARKGYPISLKQSIDICGDRWKNLSEEEKDRYKRKAKNENVSKPKEVSLEKKLTSTGKSFAQVQREEQLKQRKILDAKDSIITLVTVAANSRRGIENQPFYFIHCNYYCQLSDGRYIPCELAIIEYTIKEGIKRQFHTFIDPGPIPIGYMSSLNDYKEDTHKISHPPPEPAQNDYCKLYTDIKRFIKKGLPSEADCPPLFTYYHAETFHYNRPNEAVVESVLDGLCQASCMQMHFKVYSAVDLFYYLYNKCCDVKGVDSQKLPVSEFCGFAFEKDSYAYNKGLACDYHDNIDCMSFCSLSYIQRWTFPISDYCCGMLGLDMTPGIHCPANMHIERVSMQRIQDRTAAVSPSSSHVSSASVPVAKVPVAAASQKKTPEKVLSPPGNIEPRLPSEATIAEALKRAKKPYPSGFNLDVDDVVFPQGHQAQGVRKEIQIERPIMTAGRGRGLVKGMSQLSM